MSIPSTRVQDILKRFPKGATSDHARQAIKITEFKSDEGPEIMSISGATWNLMNRGFLKPDPNDPTQRKQINNNPFKANESDWSYVNRKIRQLDEILKQISVDNDSNPEFSKVDFMLLQEADVFTNQVNILTALPQPFSNQLNNALTSFMREIAKKNWVLLLPNRNTRVKYGLATLYNSSILDYKQEKGEFGSSNGAFNLGHEVIFTHKGTLKPVAITNVHLERDVVYIQHVLDYQYTRRKQGILNIIGGDTNHAQNDDQIGLIGSRDNATQFGGSVSSKDLSFRTRDKARELKLFEYPKRYDGFFAGPSAPDTRIRATELKGKFFKKSMTTGFIHINLLDPKADINPNYVHHNGHFLKLALGSPYMPNYLKLFFKSLEDQNLLTRKSSGAPDYAKSVQDYPELLEESKKYYKDINETYNEAYKLEKTKTAKTTGVVVPLLVYGTQRGLLHSRFEKEIQELYKQRHDGVEKIKEAERILKKQQKDAAKKATKQQKKADAEAAKIAGIAQDHANGFSSAGLGKRNKKKGHT